MQELLYAARNLGLVRGCHCAPFPNEIILAEISRYNVCVSCHDIEERSATGRARLMSTASAS